MDGRAPAEPGWTDALRGVVDEEIDRDCETLDLKYNDLGAAGAVALVPALQHAHCRLTSLNIRQNELGAAGAAALLPALQHAHCRLTVLDLGDNDLTSFGAAVLGAALQHAHCRLKMLLLGNNDRLEYGAISMDDSPEMPPTDVLASSDSDSHEFGEEVIVRVPQRPPLSIGLAFLKPGQYLGLPCNVSNQ